MKRPTYVVEAYLEEGTMFVVPKSDLDLANHKTLGGTLTGAASQDTVEVVCLDLSATEHLDATALGAIIHSSRRIKEQGKKVRILLPASGSVHTIFSVADLLKWEVIEIIEEDSLAQQ